MIAERGATSIQLQEALVNRVGCLTLRGKPQLADADSTTLIRIKHAPAELMAKALICRGFSFGKQGKPELEGSYYTTVLGLKDVPTDLKALALFNRGICNGELGKAESALADYSAVLQLNDAPVQRLAETLVNRGLIQFEAGKLDRAAADFTTVIGMRQAPLDQVAKALVNRGVCYNRQGKAEQELADYTAVIAMRNAPVDELTDARIFRGICYTRLGKPDFAIADYTAVVGMQRAPGRQSGHGTDQPWLAVLRRWKHCRSRGRFPRTARINPADPRPAYNVALILVRQEKFEAACEAYRVALARSTPDDEPLADLAALRDTERSPGDGSLHRLDQPPSRKERPGPGGTDCLSGQAPRRSSGDLRKRTALSATARAGGAQRKSWNPMSKFIALAGAEDSLT